MVSKRMCSLSPGWKRRQVSISCAECNVEQMRLRMSREIEDVPVEVSSVGVKGTLRSPFRISCPS